MCRAFHPRRQQYHRVLPLAFHPRSSHSRGEEGCGEERFPASYQRPDRSPDIIIRPEALLAATKPGRGGEGGGRRGRGRRRRDGDALPAPPAPSPLSDARPSFAAKAAEWTESVAASRKLRGRLILLAVAFLYGTLNVTLRGVYATDGPPAASVLSLTRQCLSVVTFIPLFALAKNAGELEGDKEGTDVTDAEEGTARPMWMSALELAFWNFGAQVSMTSRNKQGLINAGLLSSPAARAAFLTQTSVVLTPLISALMGERVNPTVWGGCGLALSGLYLISSSAAGGDAADSSAVFGGGDAMILLGALSWSAYIFRTSRLASSYPELDLQFAKTALLALMYLGWTIVAATSALSAAGTSFLAPGWTESLASLWPGWANPAAWLLLAYSAVGPGAVADLLQQRGQRDTSASESNIILCTESVFAAVCAFALLGEVSSMREMAGGFLIVAAAVLASR
ncbi:hypothetical protein ACHAWF_018881 [Thalassiosira exigua]